ncbi:MAG: HAD family hydrolase [Clostridiales bacterium]|nr:HAD family hydrolase [Clostridiales bacterium]
MIKLVASDLDGTLLQNGVQSISEEMFHQIRELKLMGILFVAASGRQYANMRRLFAPVCEDMAFVCENGAMAVWRDRVLYCDSFEDDLVKRIVRDIQKKEGAEFSCSTKDFYYMSPKTEAFDRLMREYLKNECRYIRNLDEITEPCMKMAVYEKEGVTEETLHYWQERFSRECTVATSGFSWVDFIPFGTDKARGIRKFQELLGITPEECLAFGDEYNDIEMLRAVTYSVAMEHGKPGVKKTAAYQAAAVEPVLARLLREKGEPERIFETDESVKRELQKMGEL